MLHGLLEVLKAWALWVAVLLGVAVVAGLVVGLRPLLLHYRERSPCLLALDLDLGDGELRPGPDAGLLQAIVFSRSKCIKINIFISFLIYHNSHRGHTRKARIRRTKNHAGEDP